MTAEAQESGDFVLTAESFAAMLERIWATPDPTGWLITKAGRLGVGQEIRAPKHGEKAGPLLRVMAVERHCMNADYDLVFYRHVPEEEPT